MKVAFCGLLLPEEKGLTKRGKRRLPGISGHKVTSSLIDGIDANLAEPVTVFNIINTFNFPNFPDIVFKTEKWSHRAGVSDIHIGYINLFGIKYITQTYNLYKNLCKWKKQNAREKCVVCVYNIHFPMLLAIYMLKRKYQDSVVICLSTGDLTGKYNSIPYRRPGIKEWLIWQMGKYIDKLAREFDCFVFATKYMAAALGVEKKPWIVLECTYSEPGYVHNTFQEKTENSTDKIIFYAGALKATYGITHLLNAFSLIKDPHYQLWIAGGGTEVPLVEEYARKDSRIKFLGYMSPEEVALRQKESTVLINPRTTEYEYVKYSFGGKTMECLASGKPYIAHRLPCDPPEYAEHIQYPDNDSDEALAKKIVEICEFSEEKREKIGANARLFILNEKNPTVMCKPVVDMWKQMLKE